MKKFISKQEKIFIIGFIMAISGFLCFGANGDVNNNGSIDINDALMVARYSAGFTVSGFIVENADTNCDKTVNINDALVIARYTANLATICPGTTTTPTPTRTPTPTPTTMTVTGSQGLFIGDSVIALSKQIPANFNTLARNNGVLAGNDSFRDFSVSGMRLAGGGSPTIPQQYANAKAQGAVKWVFMDGGGNDCLQGNCPSPVSSSCQDLVNAANAFRTLLNQMATDGVKSVIFFRYYDSPADPREKLLVLMPMMESIAKSVTNPKVYWLDLRPFFSGHPEYISSDNLHPSSAGCQVIANEVWNVAKQNNIFSN